jgi:hypothetical protein
MAPLSSESTQHQITDKERKEILDRLNSITITAPTLKTVHEIADQVLNDDGLVDEFNAPRLVVKETKTL